MKAITFPEKNKTYTKPVGWTDEQCGSLETYEQKTYNDEGVLKESIIISCWQPTAKEVADIVQGKPIWLFLHYAVQVPVSIQTENPFDVRMFD